MLADVNAEVRRITLKNRGDQRRALEVTSYAEVALNARNADQSHPAFAKLFLETEYEPANAALLCRRRPRSRDQKPVWALHFLVGPGEAAGSALSDVQFEADRARFLGRGRSVRNPAALETLASLSGTAGPVLDPLFSLRRRVELAPGASAQLAFVTAMPRDRDEALALSIRLGEMAEVNRVFDDAETNGKRQLAALELVPGEAAMFQRMAAHES